MALTNKRFADLVTFARASVASYYDAAGVLQYAPVDRARFDHDPVTLELKGMLIKEARTNLLLRSEEFDNASWSKLNSTVSADATTAPDGASTADKLTEDSAAASNHQISQAPTLATSTTYTMSIFAKADTRSWLNFTVTMDDGTLARSYFNVSTGALGGTTNCTTKISEVGGGWYRCEMTFTNSASGATANTSRIRLATADGTDAYTGDGTSGLYIWGAQMETGAFASSYIPTATATVTRSADAASITGTNFSDWFNATEGTIYIEATPIALGGTLLSLSDNTANEAISIACEVYSHLEVIDGGASQTDIDAGTLEAGATSKIAVAFKANDFAACIDGGTVATDTSGTLPTVDRMFIGAGPTGTDQASAHFKDIRFYPSRLSDAELQALTTGWGIKDGEGLLLEGDMQSGTDMLLLEGDMQSGTDVLALEGN